MKFLKYMLLIITVVIAVSCADTNAIYSEILVDDSVDAPPVSSQFKKRVLIEDYTGTWCGNCTRVSYGIKKVMEQSDKAVAVAIHNGNDPFHFANIQPLKNLVSPNNDLQLPIARLNRTIVWTEPDTNVAQVKNLTSNNCGLGLAMNSTVGEGTITLDVSVKFSQNYSNLRLVVYLLENKLIYKQEDYTTLYGLVFPQHVLQGFEHNHVLRTALTDLLGNQLTGTTFDKTVTSNFTLPIPTNISNPENMSFVAFVVDENNNVINVRESKPNETVELEENP